MKKAIAAGGDHDRIDNERQMNFAMTDQRRDHGGDNFRGIKQASLDGSDGKAGEDHLDLFPDEARADWLDARDFAGGFGDDTGDGGETVDAEGRKSLEIGLHAGAGAAVRSGDGQGHGRSDGAGHGRDELGPPFPSGGGLSAVATDGLDGAAFHGFLAEGFFLGRLGLLIDKGVAPIVVALEIGRGRLTAQVAVDALIIDIEFSVYIFRVFVCSVCHKSAV